MTVDTLAKELPSNDSGTSHVWVPPVQSDSVDTATTPEPLVVDAANEDKPKRAPAKRTTARKSKTIELTLTVTGTADGDWRAELRQGATYLARDLPVAAAAVSRAAKELHVDLATPIDEVIEEARSQQAAKVAALEAELETARRALAVLD